MVAQGAIGAEMKRTAKSKRGRVRGERGTERRGEKGGREGGEKPGDAEWIEL